MNLRLDPRDVVRLEAPDYKFGAYLLAGCPSEGSLMVQTYGYQKPCYLLQDGWDMRLLIFEDREWAAEWLWQHRHDWTVIKRLREAPVAAKLRNV